MNISELSIFRSQLMEMATLMIIFVYKVLYGQGAINYGIIRY